MARPYTISPKQAEGLEVYRKHRCTLFSGPRRSGKTGGALNCVADHAWLTDQGNIACICISQSAGIDSGIWTTLTEKIIPAYQEAGRLKWHKPPYTQNVTKKPTCEVLNQHGTVSKIQLDSLNDEKEVEARYRERDFTMIFVNQLSNFKSPKTFSILKQCLRSYHLGSSELHFLADTNPADDGERSWIYQNWYVLRTTPDDRLNPKLLARKKELALVEMMIHDNIFLTQEEVDQLVADYADDPDLYARYIEGRWVQSNENALFTSVFSHNRHVMGEVETPANPDPVIMVPENDTWELIASWDPGTSANSAAVIFEKVIRTGSDGKEQPPRFKLLDELVIVETEHLLEEFVREFVAKMRWWEEKMGRKYKWKHWSDRSVYDQKEPILNRYYHQLIHDFSDGEIVLVAANRAPGSVAKRVDITKRALFEGRLLISNDKCPNCIEMFKSLPRSRNSVAIIPPDNRHKHAFDALSYGLAEESSDYLATSFINRVRLRRLAELKEDDGLILVPH